MCTRVCVCVCMCVCVMSSSRWLQRVTMSLEETANLAYCREVMTFLLASDIFDMQYRVIAPSPAGPAMAGPFFAAGTKILNIEDMHVPK